MKGIKIESKIKKSWNDFEWNESYHKIWTLQEQLVMAYRMGNTYKVEQIQRKIVTSFEGRAIAVRKVVTNKGGKTPGIDGIIWKDSLKKMQALQQLEHIVQKPKEYKASPVMRIWIPKPNTDEKRPLGIPTMIDRAAQALYHLALDPIVEEQSDEHSFGFRKFRSTHDAIFRIRTLLDKSYSPEWILEADIEKCFDRILHKYLLEHTQICDKILLNQWLKSGIMENGNFTPDSGSGTPQGGILSPTLCNIALNGFEEEIRKIAEQFSKKPTKIHVVRYADDFIITGPDKSLLKGQIMETTEKFLEGRGLKLKDKKKNVLSIYDGFAFLGFQIKRYQWDPRKNQPKIKLTTGEPKQRTVLIIKPDKVKTQDFKSRIKKMINPNKPMESLIKDLNPLLRGWSEYYRISYHGQEIFWKLGNWIYSKMMQWAKKKHSERNTTWIVNKYVFIKDGIKWNFGINEKETIFNLSTVTNLKLVPLKEGLNPYLSENQVYFEKRQTARIQAKFRAAVFKKAKNLCTHCQQTLHGDEPVELHHIIPEKDGGKWSLQNIIPLHQLCHQNITHGNLNNKKKT